VGDLKDINIVCLGDLLLYMKISVHSEKEYLEMVQLIREADVAIMNLETLFHNYELDAYPSAEPGGAWARSDPLLMEELEWLGVDLVATANNHSLDYMYGGLFETIYNLERRGIKYAGTGRNLAEARQPTYLETSKGRIGFISAASSFSSLGRAGPARRDLQGRPGLNPQRYEEYYVVNESDYLKLYELNKRLGQKADELLYFCGKQFIKGKEIGLHTRPNKFDMIGNLESIRAAKRQADWVIFSLHCHEGRQNDHDRPAEFIEEFARSCIDEGAHVFHGHGPHVLRGIEIRDGKPIFYSLGNFIYQNFTVEKLPAEFYMKFNIDPYKGTTPDALDAREKIHHAYQGENAYKRWISIIPQIKLVDDEINELKIYPVQLGRNNPRSQRGRPMIAKNNEANKILEEVKTLSAAYGTDIKIKNGIGIVNL
jgi:poly-gamma-glutamate synthesis protein (capsule biosynthesis protein)